MRQVPPTTLPVRRILPAAAAKFARSPVFFLVLLLAALAATPAHGNPGGGAGGVFVPPVIEIVEGPTLRSVYADVLWESGPNDNDNDSDSENKDGPWLSTVTATGPLVLASASQKSYIERFSIHGEGETQAVSAANQHAEASSTVQVTFTVPIETPFSFKAAFTFSGDAGFGMSDYIGQVFFPTLVPGGEGECGGVTSVSFEDTETWEVECIGTVGPGGLTFLLVVGTNHPLDSPSGQTSASVEFDLNLGDRDHDGLLDVWEEEGIDLGEFGSIPLHEMALKADPDIKDLYIEIDELANAPYHRGDLDQLVQKFADAPVEGSDALEEHKGIRLHLIHSESGIAHPVLQGTVAQIAAEFIDIRNQHFGSPGDSEELRRAKRFVFRYALIANEMKNAAGAPLFGLAEDGTVAANGLLVAAGSIKTAVEEPLCEGVPCWVGFEEALNGVFMHELGHTLALQHGGQDQVPLKPNYLSVMNDAYIAPWNVTTEQLTNVLQYWELDYSREALPSLDEGSLGEEDGVPSATGRAALYSSSGPPECSESNCRSIALADGSPIDWNRDGSIQQDAVDSDINRLFPMDPLQYSVLVGHSDWEQLRYRPGPWAEVSSPSPSSVSEPGSAFPDEISLAEVQAFHDADWVDLTDVVEANLTVTKTNGTTTVTAGGTSTYTIVVGNAGPSSVLGASVRDLPPAELTCSWTCAPSAGAVCTAGPVGGDLIDSVDLPVGESVTYTVECLVDPDAVGTVTNRARVIPPPSVADFDPTDNEAIDADEVESSCGHPDSVVLDQQTIDTTVEATACSLVTLGGQLEVIAPGVLIVRSGGEVVIQSGFQVGSGAELRVGGLSMP